MPIDAVLDHVAVAVERRADAFPRYAGDLGGTWVSGGEAVGFAASQLRYANGMKVEILEPWAVAQNDFLRRFLDRNGPGVHHLTYKVPDLAAALDTVRAEGWEPVGVDLSYDEWKEAFLHPKQAPGIVVQLAQSAGEWSSPPPPELEAAMRSSGDSASSTLVHVTHAVADLDAALRLFADLLGGRVVRRGAGAFGEEVDLAWQGPGRVRLVGAPPGSPLAAHVGDRAGRVHHLAFVCALPDAVDGARVAGDDVCEVPPEENLGVRLLLAAAPEGFGRASGG